MLSGRHTINYGSPFFFLNQLQCFLLLLELWMPAPLLRLPPSRKDGGVAMTESPSLLSSNWSCYTFTATSVHWQEDRTRACRVAPGETVSGPAFPALWKFPLATGAISLIAPGTGQLGASCCRATVCWQQRGALCGSDILEEEDTGLLPAAPLITVSCQHVHHINKTMNFWAEIS